jgi:hypothetical protein
MGEKTINNHFWYKLYNEQKAIMMNRNTIYHFRLVRSEKAMPYLYYSVSLFNE